MNNKLVPVIIDNPCQKGWGYRTRDILITLATLVLWMLVITRMYMFFIVEEAILEQLYSSVMIKVVLIGFVVTFLTFHFWAVYNRYLYTSYLKRQLRHFQQPTLTIENDTDNDMDNEIESYQMREQEKVGITNQATS
ncbi:MULTISPECIES: hypothetical protein [Halomonadaceae]|uniref:hypothetical protein n=1 Tax=Halomonadaceae TaxID=28256 RepID=UPI000C331517|nr:hypothetical protein [Halomonas sp. MES3-P3E]PKG54063.1 hypothetical protein CXF87_05255 [Halomonas sp. MES3-P3E]